MSGNGRMWVVLEIARHLPRMISAGREAGVRRLWLFGSATGRPRRPFLAASNDADFLVEFDPSTHRGAGWNQPLFHLPHILESIIDRPVHVTEMLAFENPHFREAVDCTKELIYDREREKAPVGHA